MYKKELYFREAMFEACMYGSLCVWKLVCMHVLNEACMYGSLCVWKLVCMHVLNEAFMYGSVAHTFLTYGSSVI